MFKDKNVLVTGGSGMVGRYLTQMLVQQGATVTVASLDKDGPAGCKFVCADLTDFQTCMSLCKNMDYVFHLAGIKGSPLMVKNKPATFFVPMLMFNTNMMEAAMRNKVKWYLYTSSIGVYNPVSVISEDDVWNTMPSRNDWFAGWAKRMGELQAEAYKIEKGWDCVSIVRPAAIYGTHDNFGPDAMVIPSLIWRVCHGENPLVVWNTGEQVRDFIHAEDVARGMLFAVENKITKPLNLGSGTGVKIKELVETIVKNVNPMPEVTWDLTKPGGDQMRVLNTSLAKSLGFETKITLEDGIKATIDWYMGNFEMTASRYNVFSSY